MCCNHFLFFFLCVLQSELAKRSYLRAKDHSNIARIREIEGDYSGAVRVLTRANRRLQALESAQMYEKQGHVLEVDVSTFQLANQYAKFFIARRDEVHLRKVLSYVDDPFVRVAHLKKGRLYRMAVEEYIKSDKMKEAVELILAQEMYDQGLQLARERKEVKKGGMKLESLFQIHKSTAKIYHSRSSKGDKDFTPIVEVLANTGHEGDPAAKAKAKLLMGIVQENSSLCHDALRMYQNPPLSDMVGGLEAYNEMVKLKKTEGSVQMIASQCFQAKELSTLFVAKSAKAVKILKSAMEFYHLSHLENVYLLPKSQDIWFGNLHSLASIKDKPVDENGLIRLDPEKVHKALEARFSNFVNEWVEKTVLVKQLKEKLHSYRYHRELSKDQTLTRYHEGLPTHVTSDYIVTIDMSMKLATIIPGCFDNQLLAKLVPNIFSPLFSFCVPLSKANRAIVDKCLTVQDSLKSDVHYFLENRFLFKPNVDELFDAWKCSCLINSVVDMEHELEEFAAKKGPGTTPEQEKSKFWLFIDRKGKPSYHYFFSYLLKAYRLIRESCQVIGSMKIIFHCFLSVIGRRPGLRKKTSICNIISVTNICSTALIALLSMDNPTLSLLLPCYYKNQCHLFDILNAQDNSHFWLLSACSRQIYDLSNERLARLVTESTDLLCKLVSYLVGQFCEHYNVLEIVVSGKEESWLVHTLVNLLVLLSNIRLLSKDNTAFVSENLERMESIIRVGIKLEG